MKITHLIASGAATFGLLAVAATPSLASAQYQYQPVYSMPYSYSYANTGGYNTGYGYSGNGYWCGSYWSTSPCTYSYSNSGYQYPSYNYSYSYPQYTYQPNWYGQGYSYYNNYSSYNNGCPVGYYLWGTNCWPNPSTYNANYNTQYFNTQFWYPAY